MGYLGAVGHSVFALDVTQLRRWSAVRRGALVAVTLIIGVWATNPEIGALASISSLFVGLQDRNASASYTSRVMLVQSVFFACVVLVAGLFSEFWMVPAVILATSAVIAGLAAEHDTAMSRMFGDVMPVAAFLGLSTVDSRTAVISAAAVLLGGLAQALSAGLSVRVEGDIIERRTVAAALVAVADHLEDALRRQRTDTGRAAEERLLTASAALASSDLSPQRLGGLQRILADAEILRQEAGALRLRRAHHLPVAHEAEVANALATAAAALRATATMLGTPSVPRLRDRKADVAANALARLRQAATAVLDRSDSDLTARALARQTLRVAQDIHRVVGTAQHRSKQSGRTVGEGMLRYVLHPSRRSALAGARLGAATIVSLVLAAVLQVPHGAWVAATAVALLRDDRRAVTAGAMARALGTMAASALVIPFILLTGGSDVAEVLTILLLATATYAVAQANEGLSVLTIAAQVVYMRAAVGEDALAVAMARVEDVMLGSGIAVAFLLLVPISHGPRLARDLATYADATARWVEAIVVPAARSPATDPQAVRRTVRDARVHVQQDLDMRVVEPWGPGISPERGAAAFLHIHEVARTTAAVERSLRHGEAPGPTAAGQAEAIAETLRATAAALQAGGSAVLVTEPPRPESTPGNAISLLLAAGAAEAAAALQAVTGAETPSVGRR